MAGSEGTGAGLQSDVITIADTHDSSSGLSLDVVAPAGRMDADNYTAEDLDGVTHGLFGSGNLNYLTLQGRETDEMLAAGTGEQRLGDMEHVLTENAVAAIGGQAIADSHDIGPQQAHGSVLQDGAQGEHSLQSISQLMTGAHGQIPAMLDGGAMGGAAGMKGALDAVFNHGGGADGMARAGADGVAGASGINGNDGAHGGAGAGGADGHDGSGLNVTVDVDVTVNHVLSPIENILNTTVNDTTTLIDNSVGDVTSTVTNVTGDVTDIVNNLLGGGGDGDIDLYEHNDIGLPQVNLNLDPVEAIVGDINTGVTLAHDAQGATVSLDALAAGLPLAHATLPVEAPVVGQILSDIPATDTLLHAPVPAVTDAVSDIANTVTSLADVPSVNDILQDPASAVTAVADTVVGDVTSILAPPASGDADIFAHNDLGLPQVDVGLDPVENIVGDTDAGVDITHGQDGSVTLGTQATALGDSLVGGSTTLAEGGAAGALTHTVESALSDPATAASSLPSTLTDTVANIASGTPPDTSASDTDLSVHNDLGLPQVDVNLDPVESVTGDLDIGVDATHSDSALDAGANAVALGGTLLDTGATVMDGGLAGNTVADVTHDVSSGALTDAVGGILDNASALDGAAGNAQSVLDAAAPTAGGDALGGIAGDVTGGGTTGDVGTLDAGLWPQTDTTGVSSAVADGIGSLLGGDASGTSALSSPEGSVGEGLGLLSTGTEHDGSALSGLGGAVHHGLFG